LSAAGNEGIMVREAILKEIDQLNVWRMT